MVAIAAVFALAGGSSSRAASSVSFVDPSGDSITDSVDITNVNVSTDDTGNVHFQISTPNSASQANGGGLEVDIDSDLSPSISSVTVDPTSVTASPSRPQAGENFTLSFNAKSNSGAPLPSGTVDCAATVGGASLVGSGTFSSGTGTCTWQIPATAGGKPFVAHGTVSYPGATTNGVFDLSAVVVGQASLHLDAVTKTQLLAGKTFTIGVAVLIHQAGIADTRIQQGSVGCRATIGGHALHVTKTQVTAGKGVQCTWSVPKTAHGKTMHAVLTVHSAGLSVQHSYNFPVH